MKNSLLLLTFLIFSLGLLAFTEAEVSVNRLVERDLVPINVKIKVTAETLESQTFSTHDEGKCYFDLRAGNYLLQIVSEHFPNYEVPLIIDDENELNSFFFSIIVSDLENSSGEILGMQVSSFQKKKGHQCQAYNYALQTEKMIQSIEFNRGKQPDLLVNSSFFYSTSPSEMRGLIDSGDYTMDHDDVSNVFYSYNGKYDFLNTKSEMRYTSVVRDVIGIADSKSYTPYAEVKEPRIKGASITNDKFFSVQLGVFRRPVKARKGEFLIKNKEGLNVLCKGEFSTYQEAKHYKQELLDSGLEGVFVIGNKDGRKVSVSDM